MDLTVSPSDLDRLAVPLDRLLREAGEIALGFYRRGARQWLKNDTSPVTEADIAVDTFLKTHLPPLLDGSGWLSEETADSTERLDRRHVWIVDPIDGTRSFASGHTDWVISVALVEDGYPVLAGLFNPVRAEMFAARRHGGATLNGAVLAARDTRRLEGAVVCGPKAATRNLAAVGLVEGPWVHALAYRFALVAAGRLDAALSRGRAKDWDIAAADLLLTEAGGHLSDLDGVRPVYNRPAIVHPPLMASGRNLQAALLAVADKAFPPHLRSQEDSA